ncbi:MAG: recombinase family protein [Clostridiales bacterium]|jgi:site-specific DNA recombinase|nr:recombinase family protein [Clostridiales bacterium]
MSKRSRIGRRAAISSEAVNRRVVLYLRVSTTRQAEEGYSLDAQERNLCAWCESRGHTVVSIYRDEGISAKDVQHRPALQQMIDDAKTGDFDLILFWSLSRFTRSVRDLYELYQQLSAIGIEIISATEPIDTTTPMGRAMMGLLTIFAQMERELTSERVYYAMEERAKQGKRTCNEVLGYNLLGGDNLTINVVEAEQVRYIFDRYTEYKNLQAVAELCRLKGYRGKRGREHAAWTIRKILTRPIYCGYNSYDGSIYRGMHEPIISATLFNRVQDILDKRSAQTGRKRAQTANLRIP